MNKKLKQEIEALFRELHKGYAKAWTFQAIIKDVDVPQRLSHEPVKVARTGIKVKTGNTGVIYYGFDKLLDATHGFELSEETIYVDDLSKIWIVGTTADDVACVVCYV